MALKNEGMRAVAEMACVVRTDEVSQQPARVVIGEIVLEPYLSYVQGARAAHVAVEIWDVANGSKPRLG